MSSALRVAESEQPPRRFTEGGYLIEGRAAHLERMITRLAEHVDTRVDELELRVAHAEALALDLLRAQTGALLEVLRTRGGT